MRYITIAFALVGALLAAACDPSGNRDPTLFCQVNLTFVDDDARAAFLERNADSIVRQTPHIMLSSRLTAPEITLASERDACPGNGLDRAFRLHGVDDAATTVRTATLQQIVDFTASDRASYQSWDQDDARQCVAHVAGHGGDEEFALMEGLVMSGLRDPQVHSSGASGLFFSAAEACGLVEQIARSALAKNSATDRNLRLCANSSHRACGDSAIFSSGTASPDEVDRQFDEQQAKGTQ